VALNIVNDRLQSIREVESGEHIGAIVSPNLSIEEQYLAQKYMRGLESPYVEHRLQQVDGKLIPAAALPTELRAKIADVETMDSIFLVGCDIQREIPLLGLRVRKASLQDAVIASLNPVDFKFNFSQNAKCIIDPEAFVLALAILIKSELAPGEEKNLPLLAQLTKNDVDYCGSAEYRAAIETQMSTIKSVLASGDKKLIIMGALAVNHPQASLIQQALLWLAQRYGAQFMMLAAGANHYGAVLAGAMSESGKTVTDLWRAKLAAYLLINVEPELDCTHPALALKALHDAECVVAMTAFTNERMFEYAHVLLPIAPFSEYAGTMVNLEGKWQEFNAATHPKGEARPAWKVLRVLAELAQIPGFAYDNWKEISREIKHEAEKVVLSPLTQHYSLPMLQHGLHIQPYWPMYRSDSLVRRAEPLQRCALIEEPVVLLHPQTAVHYGLQDGDSVSYQQDNQVAIVGIKTDKRVAPHTLYWPMGFADTAGLWSLTPLLLESITVTELT
jgi:NADH-quinone oxidoreductase subunit G